MNGKRGEREACQIDLKIYFPFSVIAPPSILFLPSKETWKDREVRFKTQLAEYVSSDFVRAMHRLESFLQIFFSPNSHLSIATLYPPLSSPHTTADHLFLLPTLKNILLLLYFASSSSSFQAPLLFFVPLLFPTAFAPFFSFALQLKKVTLFPHILRIHSFQRHFSL